MNVYERMARAMEIFNSYEHERGIHAEHDQITAGPDPDDVSVTHIAELEALGWHADDNGYFYHFT